MTLNPADAPIKACDKFYEGEFVVMSPHSPFVGKTGRIGRVVGFSAKHPYQMFVLRHGRKQPQSWHADFWLHSWEFPPGSQG